MTDLKWMGLVAIVAAVGSSGGSFIHDQINPPRPDPHTSADDAKVMRELKDYWAEQLDLLEIRLKLHIAQLDRPPMPTRQRIKALERHAETTDGYIPPTFEWNDEKY